MKLLAGFLKAIADEGRLRVLRLLLLEDGGLNVGELVRILGLAQSSVSQKLAALRKAGLVREKREGGFAYYELVRQPGEASFELLAAELGKAPDPHGDLARLGEVRRERADRGEASEGKLVEPGRSWVAWARALRHLIPALRVADFGCGDGALTAEVAAFASSVAGIEKSAARLARARERMARLGLTNVSFLHEAIETTSLRASTCDLVLASHVLHHVPDPQAVLRQAFRVLVRGGRVLVLELAPHGEGWVKEKLGHLWLGFAPAYLEKGLQGAGFGRVEVERVAGAAAREPFRLLIATAVKPS